MPIAEMMSSRGKRCPTKIWFAAILLIYILPAVFTDPCEVPASSVTVTENVANGSMLLKINYTANQNWTIQSQFPPGYFELMKRNTSFYLITAKVLDYDVLKEKADGMIVNLQCKADKYSLVSFEVFILMNKLNEFVPQFTQRAYNKTIAENARIGDVVFIASTKATDNDYNDPLTFEAVKYSQGKNPLDGISSGKFKMADPKTGRIVVADYLDYEKQKKYIIKLVVRDSGGNATSAKLSINIADVDEIGPTFQPIQCELKNIPCQIPVIYHTQIKAADKGPMTIIPNAVKAVDMEADHFNITYSLTEGDPIDIEKHFKIDAHTGSITKETEFANNVTSPVTLFIKGEEQSKLKHSSVAILIIKILDRNSTIFVSTKSTDSSPISNPVHEGFSPEVFYGVLIPLAIIVGALILCIVIIVIKSKKSALLNDAEDFKTGSNKSIHTNDSLLSRNCGKGTNPTHVDIHENGLNGVANRAFMPDICEDENTGKVEHSVSVSTEDNDVHPRSLHSDDNLDEFGYCNITAAGMYTTTNDLRKAGVEEEKAARDGDIHKNYLTNDENGPENDAILTNSNEPDRTTHNFSDNAPDDAWSDRVPAMPVPDYFSDDVENHDDSKGITPTVPNAKGQLDSEVSEYLLKPDFIENVSQRSASSESTSARISPQIESDLKSDGTTDDAYSESNSMTERDKTSNTDEDNTLPEWASSALQPTITPMRSREEFRYHLESLMSSQRQLPSSKIAPSSTTLGSSKSPANASEKETSAAPPPPPPSTSPPPPPPPPQLPSSSTAEAPSTYIYPAPTRQSPLPPIQMMATHL